MMSQSITDILNILAKIKKTEEIMEFFEFCDKIGIDAISLDESYYKKKHLNIWYYNKYTNKFQVHDTISHSDTYENREILYKLYEGKPVEYQYRKMIKHNGRVVFHSTEDCVYTIWDLYKHFYFLFGHEMENEEE